jgi:hypothetical protein
MRIRNLSRREREAVLERHLQAVEFYERGLRNSLAAVLEFAASGDDVHTECRRVLEALDGL